MELPKPSGFNLAIKSLLLWGLLELPAVKEAIAVPSAAILNDEGRSYVWVAREGTVERRLVQIGVSAEGFLQATDGLRPGELVVVDGLGGLMDGAPVELAAEP